MSWLAVSNHPEGVWKSESKPMHLVGRAEDINR
jgi:hypothetical protein